mmetsp:Transcript_40184/g.94069  ORF Transcript_40184/g.94069 Transcript_40184/m.94069 type:complete len:216 (+) Transcript_40184:324-971(+)
MQKDPKSLYLLLSSPSSPVIRKFVQEPAGNFGCTGFTSLMSSRSQSESSASDGFTATGMFRRRKEHRFSSKSSLRSVSVHRWLVALGLVHAKSRSTVCTWQSGQLQSSCSSTSISFSSFSVAAPAPSRSASVCQLRSSPSNAAKELLNVATFPRSSFVYRNQPTHIQLLAGSCTMRLSVLRAGLPRVSTFAGVSEAGSGLGHHWPTWSSFRRRRI